MESIESIVFGLQTEIAEGEKAFAAKYISYDQDKKELEEMKKKIANEINNRLQEYRKQKEDELKAVKDEIKRLNPKSEDKREYVKNEKVLAEVVELILVESPSHPEYMEDSKGKEYLEKEIVIKIDEIANYKRAKAKEEISNKALAILIEKLSISA